MRGRKLARYADKNNYAIYVPDSAIHIGRTCIPNLLDIYLHHMELPVKDGEPWMNST